MELISANKSFGGWQQRYRHIAKSTQCEMTFTIYLPPQVDEAQNENNKVPVLYWLSGLTCTDENFMQKAGAQRVAATLGIAIVAPDTSPRGKDINGDDIADNQSYDLGQGAGFYLNATQKPWKKHYQMYDYIVSELPQLIDSNFPVTDKKSIFGHSMGGHGALTIALKNNDSYCSASAFSPISNPVNVPWGKKAFTAYLGDNQDNWLSYDTCELLENTSSQLPLLIDQGSDDEFLAEQLSFERLQEALNHYASNSGNDEHGVRVRLNDGYDHSYYFIASFIAEHIRFHHQYLSK